MSTMTLERPAVENIHDARPCPLCAGDMPIEDVRCAMSRYTNRSICSSCGMVEALALAKLNENRNNRSCLYYDDVMGVAMVHENEAGYRSMWPHPADPEWVKGEYVPAVNTRHGLDWDDAMAIVARSMGLGMGGL